MGYFQVHFSTTLNDLFQKIMVAEKKFFSSNADLPLHHTSTLFFNFSDSPLPPEKVLKIYFSPFKKGGGSELW